MASSTTPPGTPPSEAPPLETPPLATSPKIPPYQSQDETLPSTSIAQTHGSVAAAAEGPRDIQSKKEHHQKHDPWQTLNPTLKTYLSQSNDHIHHLNRLLTTTPSVDLILSTTSYTLALLSTLLPSDHNIPLTRAQPLHHRLSNLTSLLSETRTTLRLFGLIPIYTWAHSTYHSPNPNPTPSTLSTPSTLISRYITTTQILAGIAFQILENLAYLGDKNILPISTKRRSKYWLWCCRAWALHVFLELAKLLLLRWRFVNDAPTPAAKPIDAEKSSVEGVVQTTQMQDQRDLAAKKEQEATWWRDFKINLAYAPMTLHYSLANGLLNDSTVALCGILASYWGLKGAWIRSA
ncbi:MAG: hypothetical protein L6R42_009845 [Xanthoria sp. 1 TBL-2021]|nr:MAG: hypothetical protein L6R42_009845 [Xanthoria sp. 1 TBL-2021]